MSKKNSHRFPLLILLYAVAVLTIATAAQRQWAWPMDWTIFRWSPLTMYPVLHNLQQLLHLPNASTQWLLAPTLQSFDAFAFVTWLLIPLTAALFRIDKAAFGFRRWKRRDKFLLLGIALVVAIALVALQKFPTQHAFARQSLQRIAPSTGSTLPEHLLWIASWLLGWEFLLRYVLLNRLNHEWPRCGWRCLPLVEGLFYLQASAPEALARCLFAIILTRWTLKRRNLLIAIVAHLIIEVELAAFLLYR